MYYLGYRGGAPIKVNDLSSSLPLLLLILFFVDEKGFLFSLLCSVELQTEENMPSVELRETISQSEENRL